MAGKGQITSERARKREHILATRDDSRSRDPEGGSLGCAQVIATFGTTAIVLTFFYFYFIAIFSFIFSFFFKFSKTNLSLAFIGSYLALFGLVELFLVTNTGKSRFRYAVKIPCTRLRSPYFKSN
jgi:hypothetical protein